MGGVNSGRMTGAEERKAARARAKAKTTQETALFKDQVQRQRGDRLFKVRRVYRSGIKATVGTIDSTEEDRVGAQYGGGVYELHEIDRATNQETGPVVRLTLHPSTYPPIAAYDKDPHELERSELGGGFGPPSSGSSMFRNLQGLGPEQIYAKALEEATEKVRAAQLTRDLERRLDEMNAKLAAGNAGGGGSRMDEFLQMLAAVEKLRPAPTPSYGANADPMTQVQTTLELFKQMKTVMGELGAETAGGKVTPMAEKLISSLAGVADRGFRVYEAELAFRRTGGQPGAAFAPGQPAAQGWANTRNPAQPQALAPAVVQTPASAPAGSRQAPQASQPQGWANTSRTAPRPSAAPTAAAQSQPDYSRPGVWPQATPGHSPQLSDFPNAQAFEQFQEDAMTYELVEFAKKEMAGILSGAAGFSAEQTAQAICARWRDPRAAAPWVRLRSAVTTYDTHTVLNHLIGLQPDLCPTENHRNLLGALIDLCRQYEGASV